MDHTMASDETARVLGTVELTRGLTIQMTAIGTLGVVVGYSIFGGLYQLGTGDTVGFQFVPATLGWIAMPLNVLVLVFLATFFLVPHEWLHGLAIRYYGGTAQYGVGLAHFILPYAYTSTDHELSRNQFIVVLMTPLVVMTLVGVPAMLLFSWDWLVLPLTLNTAGAVADVWMTVSLLGYPAHVRVVDFASGIRILGRETDEPRALSVTAVVWDALAGAAIATVVGFLALAIGGPIVLAALGVDSFTLGTPGTITYLFSFVDTPTEIALGVGPGVLGLGGCVGLVYALVRTYRRRSSEPTHGP